MISQQSIKKTNNTKKKYICRIITILQILLMGFFLFSCKSKNAIDTKTTKDSLAIDSLKIDSIKIHNNQNLPKDANANIPINDRIDFYEKVLIHPTFEHLKIRSKIDLEIGNSIPTLDATIYIENNQKIWMNLSVFLNMARGMATPEGIKAYSIFNSTYIDSNFDYLNHLLNIDFINYPTLQKILMGRTFIPIKDSQFILSKNMDGYYMISKKNLKFVNDSDNTPAKEYKVLLKYSINFDLEKVQLWDATSNNELQIYYENWENFNNYRLPKNVKIIIKGNKNGQILIENTKFEDLKMQTPYSVPKKYTKIEIQ
jgi:hypothetical protein